MKNVKLLPFGLLPPYVVAIIINVHCEINPSMFDLPSHLPTEFLSRKEVAHLLGVDLKTVYTWSKQKKLRAYHFGGYRVFYKRSEIIESIITFNL